MLEDADVLVCGQYQNGLTHTKVKPTKGKQLFCLICPIFSIFMLPLSQRVSF